VDLEFSDEQRIFADALRRFLAAEYGFEHRRALVAAGAWGDPAIWAQLGEMGCFGIAVPEELGGFGGNAIQIGLMMRELGRRLALEPVRAAVVSGTLLAGARDAQAYLADLVTGAVRFAPVPRADNDDAALRRTERTVEGGAAAQKILVPTKDALLVVDSDALKVSRVRLLSDAMAADIRFDDPPAVRLDVGNDWEDMQALAAARAELARCWEALGSIEAALEATTAHVRERRQFGRPLAAFQAVQHRIAEMVVAAKEVEVAALLAALVLDGKGIGPEASRALAVATHRIAASASVVADGAVQLHGGMGVSDELDISAHFRHLQAFRACDGGVAAYAESVVSSGAHHRSAVLLEA